VAVERRAAGCLGLREAWASTCRVLRLALRVVVLPAFLARPAARRDDPVLQEVVLELSAVANRAGVLAHPAA
jgi:hypothetical protein